MAKIQFVTLKINSEKIPRVHRFTIDSLCQPYRSTEFFITFPEILRKGKEGKEKRGDEIKLIYIFKTFLIVFNFI